MGMTGAAIGFGTDWREALEMSLAGVPGPADLTLLFASAEYAQHFPEMLARVRAATGCRVLLGCSGQGIIGGEREIEDRPAISVLSLALPGAWLQPLYLDQALLEASGDSPELWSRAAAAVGGTPVTTAESPRGTVAVRAPEGMRAVVGARGAEDVTGAEDVSGAEGAGGGEAAGDVALDGLSACVLFADPFHLDCEGVLGNFNAAFPGVPMAGGLASSSVLEQRTYLFLNNTVYDRGAVAVAVGGCDVRTVVSQGADPIGEPWMVTASDGPVVHTIAQRPAYTVLAETVQALPREAQQRASRNLLVGLAIDEYQERWGRGDFLIRNLTGADPTSGALAVSAYPRPGQTIQFQVRDARAADEDLKQLLAAARESLGSASPAGVLLCSCNGRGQGLFGVPDHDARALAEQLGPVPVAGFFCNGEVGPVGKRNFLHGFTASLALFLPQGEPAA